jgi:hypothetical protein
MTRGRLLFSGALSALVACAPAPPADANGSSGAAPPPAEQQQASVSCSPSPNMPVAGRPSPYDSTAVQLGDSRALVCYGRPSMRGRTVFGGLVPSDTI